MLLINGQRNIKENEKPIPFGLRLASNQWPKNIKVNEKPIPSRLRLTSNQWPKENEKLIPY